MKTFSPSEAAFEGFRIMRANPGALVVWIVGYLLLLIALGASVVVLIGPAWDQFAPAFNQLKQGDPSGMKTLMDQMQSLRLLLSPIQFVVVVVFNCAIYRAVLRPRESGYGFIRLGLREVLVGLLRLIYVVMIFGIAFVVTIGLVILFAIAAAATGAAQAGKVDPSFAGWSIFGVALVLTGIAIWLATRLSLAQPMTFAARRLQLFESWSLTRGRFWPMLGAYLLAWFMGFVISLIAVVAVGAVALMLFAPFLPQLSSGTLDWSAPTPRMLGLGVLGLWALTASILGPITQILLMAPGAYIYRTLSAKPETTTDLDGKLFRTPPGVLVL